MAITDKIVPTLTLTTPKVTSTQVKVGSNLVLKFNESVKAGTGNIIISDGKDIHKIAIADKSQVTFAGNTIRLNPTDNLLPNSHYSVRISATAITDLAGNKFAGILNTTALSFSTVDTLSPQLDAITTKNLSVPAVTKNLVFTFNEAVKAGAGIIVLSNGFDTRKIAITDKSQVTFDGKTITLNPEKDLQGDSLYSVTFRNTVIKDLAGNKFAEVSDKTVLSFHTVDNVAPQLDALSVENLSAPIAIDKNLVLVFNEAVKAGVGNIVVSNGIDTRTIPVTDSQVSINDKTVTINPTVDLNFGSTYSVKLAAGTLNDMAGNAFSGNEPKALVFTTVAKPIVIDTKPFIPVAVIATPATDEIAPTLTSSSPADNSTNILAGANLVLTFSEAMKAGSGNIVISNGSDIRTISIADKTQITMTDKTVTINPTTDFVSETTYNVLMATGVLKDVAGNSFAGITDATALDFTTTAAAIITTPVVTPPVYTPPADTTPPTPVYTPPADTTPPAVTLASSVAAMKVGETATITATFSEAVTGFTVDDFVSVAGAFSHFVTTDSSHYSALFTPTPSSTATDSAITIAANSYTDTAGNNGGAGTKPTLAIDMIAPTVTLASSVAAVKVGETATITASFSEAVTGFTVDDFVSAGTFSHFVTTDSSHYSALFTPTPSSTATDSAITIAANSYTDTAGNNGGAGTKPTLALDFTTTPVVTTPVVTTPVVTPPVVTPPVVTPPTTPSVDLPLDPNDKTAPTLSSFTPNDNSVDVANGANIVLNFSEAIKAGTGNIILSGSNADVRVIDIKDSTQVTINGQTLTVNPTDDLSADHFYSVHINAGVVKDLSNNAFAGINDDTTFNFRTAPFVLTGKVIDGYVKNADVFADANGDGVWNTGEAKATSNANGEFTLTNAKGSIVASGGIDGSTGKAFEGVLKAPMGSTVVTPLTTIQQGFVEAGQSPAEAQKSVAQAFGFDSTKVDLKNYDPIVELTKTETTGTSATAKTFATQMMAHTAQVANFFVTAGQTLQGAAGGKENLSTLDVGAALVKSFVAKVQDGNKAADAAVKPGAVVTHFKIDLGDAAFLKTVLIDGAKEVNAVAAKTPAGSVAQAPKFDAATFSNKIDKMADNVVTVLKDATDNIAAAITKGGNAADLLTNFTKVSSFAQNDAGAAIQKAFVAFNPNDVAAGNVFKDALANLSGDKADAAILAKVDITPFTGLDAGVIKDLPPMFIAILEKPPELPPAGTLPPVVPIVLPVVPVVPPVVDNGGGGSTTTTTTPNSTSTLISNAGTGTSAATTGVDTFYIAPGNYTHTISGFATGDKLNFFHDAILNVVPDSSDADLAQSITATDPNSGAVATIILSALTAAQDVGLFNVPSFVTQFGASTITQTFDSTSTATAGADAFVIAAGIPTINIAGFANGDKLVFFANAVLNVVNDPDQTDGNQSLTASDPATGATTMINLTGITAAQDAGVFNVPSFVTQFGAGAIA